MWYAYALQNMHIKFEGFGSNKIESTNIKTIAIRYNAPNHIKVSCNHFKKKKKLYLSIGSSIMVLSMNSMIYNHTTKEAKHKHWKFFADKAIISVKPFNLHSFSLTKRNTSQIHNRNKQEVPQIHQIFVTYQESAASAQNSPNENIRFQINLSRLKKQSHT